MSLTKVSYSMIDSDPISVLDFGADNTAATDSTVAIQAAIDYCLAQGLLYKYLRLYFPQGKYAVDTLTINSPAYTFSMYMEGCEFIASATVTRNGIFDLINANTFDVLGSHTLNGANNQFYSALWSIRASATGSLQRVNIYNPTFRLNKFGFRIGDKAIPFACSEINIFGANFYSTPVPVYLAGGNSLAQFHGCNIVSDSNTNFPTVPERAIWLQGGSVKVTGGSIVVNPVANSTVFMNPSNGTGSNSYASLIVVGTHIESNSGRLAIIQNPESVAAPFSGTSCLIFQGCTGFSSSEVAPGDFITALDSTYAGTVSVTGCDFYTGAVRTNANMSSSGTLTKFVTDRTSFGYNFKNWIAGISQGIAVVESHPILAVSSVNQTVNSGASATLIFTNNTQVTTVPELERYSSGYNNSTGVFTVPYKIKQADVSVNLQYSGGGTIFFGLRVNGTYVSFAQSSNGVAAFNETIFNLVAGDVLDIYLTASTANAVFAPASTLTWRINGYEY
jgi:hypothetical protein